MNVDLNTALAKIGKAAPEIFDADATVRSVGVGAIPNGHAFVAVRNVRASVPFGAGIGRTALTEFDGIPVTYTKSNLDPAHLARVPFAGPASPGVGSVIPEQQAHLPLRCGLQIQNYDDDVRSGEIARGYIIIGSLGCFVKLASGEIAILSNNHVVAGENRGIRTQDRIAHPGSSSLAQHIATLTDFTALLPSPAGASIADGTAQLNEIDAGVATLATKIGYAQTFLMNRLVKAPSGIAPPALGDKVHKVGRTTGLTFGTVTQLGVIVGPVPYAPGHCWFQHCIAVEGANGTTFSDHGDSGSTIIRDDGMVIGLLFAGNDTQTYGCSIGKVLNTFNCQLA